MRRPARIRCTLVVALGVALLCSVAPAMAEEACTSPELHLVTPEGDEWRDAADRLGQYLRAAGDLDRCARVTGRPDGDGVLLEVTTSDGRTASRHVSNVAELLRTSEALLVLPPKPPPRAVQTTPAELPPRELAKPPAAAATHHVELGVGGAVRLGGSPLFIGGGIAGFAAFAQGAWLLSASARWDAIEAIASEPTPMDFYMQSEAVGVSFGRRFALSHVLLDALVGPNIVLESQEADDVDSSREVHGASADFRLGVALRLSGPRFSSLRAFATADFEASPARLRASKTLDPILPTLPAWSSGLAVGVAWGLE